MDNFYAPQLINLYPISNTQFNLTIAWLGAEQDEPELHLIYELIATNDEDGNFSFACPLDHKTRHWKTETVGLTTYYFKEDFNRERAQTFARKNKAMAEKFGLEAEGFQFYLCDHYQELIQLLGFVFDAKETSKFRNGHGVDEGHIFSIMNNEDFSHDVFHYYSGKINKRENRNWITEEGLAYSWGNAYWTDPNGDMITMEHLVPALQSYLKRHPEESYYSLFQANAKIFTDLAPEASAKSTISAIICDEVERQHGKVGVDKMINCGRSSKESDNYFKAIGEMLDIDRENFNERVSKLVNDSGY